MARKLLLKAPADPRKATDFLQYMRWEENRYHFSEREAAAVHIPSEKKLAGYYKADTILRARLCRISSCFPESSKKDALISLLYRRIDENMGRIFHERDPAGWPDPSNAGAFIGRQRGKEANIKVVRLPICPHGYGQPLSEHIFTGTDARSV